MTELALRINGEREDYSINNVRQFIIHIKIKMMPYFTPETKINSKFFIGSYFERKTYC